MSSHPRDAHNQSEMNIISRLRNAKIQSGYASISCWSAINTKDKGTLLGTPNREPQEYSSNIMEYKDPGRYIPIIYLPYSWSSRFGVPSRVPLKDKAAVATTKSINNTKQ